MEGTTARVTVAGCRTIDGAVRATDVTVKALNERAALWNRRREAMKEDEKKKKGTEEGKVKARLFFFP
jgi:hypothetical protein